MSENKNNNKNNKIIRINIGFSWFYLLLIGGIIWMLSKQPSANPQKVEWAEVEAMIEAGDVKEIKFVRNDFKGEITVRPERLAKYSDKFGGNVPARSPHFTFMVSTKFDSFRRSQRESSCRTEGQDHSHQQRQGMGTDHGMAPVPASPGPHVGLDVPRNR